MRTAVTLLWRVARRLSGWLVSKRSGYVFIWSRVILTRLERLATRAAVGRRVDVVTLDGVSARAPGAWYRELEPPGVGVTPPPGWVWPRTFVGTVNPPARFVAARASGVVEIPGGVVFGTQGHFGTDPNGLLLDAGVLWHGGEDQAIVDVANALEIRLEALDGVTMSVWADGQNYCHCLLQSVPRLDLLRRGFGLEADRFLVNAAAPRATLEALDRLGIPADRRHLVPLDGPAYRCETLRAATSPHFHDWGVGWAAAFLNELFLPVPPDNRSRRLYVRRGVPKRAVLNEDEVLAVLAPYGFEVVTMEGRSINEQAAMFASAAVVVAPHGAALANLVFCRPGTAVIELMGTNTASQGFSVLSWRRGLDYQLVMGTEPAPPGHWWTWQIDADTVVDVRGLQQCLELLGLR
jgi:hypothetical protein